MKKIIFIILLGLFCVSFSYGQGRNVMASPDKPIYTYVGSLIKNKNSSANREKIKIEVFGGDYGSADLGTITYAVGTRYNYNISKEVRGGNDADSRHILKVYDNNDKLDVVIVSISWGDFMVRSWILDPNPIAHEVECKDYNPSGKIDVTAQFKETIFLTSTVSGNIGIGVEKPTERLDVNGTIRAKEVKIEATGWSDFVFDKDYKLPALSSVEKHIQEYKHLPDIPSESDVIESGISVGQMQAKLLQKIEELTLYVIEQDKKYNVLKEENATMKKENEIIKEQLEELKQNQTR